MREDWVEVELGKALIIERGGSPRPIKEYITDSVDGINWIKIGDTQINSKYIKQTSEKIKPEGLKKTRFVKKGDLLLSNSMSFGRPYILDTDGAIHDGWLVLKNATDFKIDSEFLYYVLSSPIVFAQFDKLATGSTVRNLNTGLVARVIAPIAPLPIQRAIVQKIENLFASLDKGIADLKTAQEQLKVYRQAVLKKAFEGKFTNKNIKEGELPEGWIFSTLGDIISINSGTGLTKAKRSDEGEYFVYGGNGVTGKHDEYIFEEEKVIIGRVGVHCGNTHITKPKSWITDNAFIVTFDEKSIDLKFLHHLLKVCNLNKYASSTAQPVISQGKIYPIEITYPKNKFEQHAIVREIESRLSVCDKVEQNISEALEKAEALRQSILKKAFEGKLLSEAEIAKCKQEADYEPAAKLLERIKTTPKG